MRALNVVLRVVAAIAALVAGYAHLKLYNDGYDKITDQGKIWIVGGIGHQFLLNFIAAVLIALGLVLPLVIPSLPGWISKLAAVGGLVWSVVSLFAFRRAHYGTAGWFGYQDEPGLHPSPEAAMSVYPEIIVGICCLILVVLAFARRPDAAATTVTTTAPEPAAE